MESGISLLCMFGATNIHHLYMLSSPILWRQLGMAFLLATVLFLGQVLAIDNNILFLVYVIYTCHYSTFAMALFLSCSLCPASVHVLEPFYLIPLRNSRLLRNGPS